MGQEYNHNNNNNQRIRVRSFFLICFFLILLSSPFVRSISFWYFISTNKILFSKKIFSSLLNKKADFMN
jgi:hypothetical protein